MEIAQYSTLCPARSSKGQEALACRVGVCLHNGLRDEYNLLATKECVVKEYLLLAACQVLGTQPEAFVEHGKRGRTVEGYLDRRDVRASGALYIPPWFRSIALQEVSFAVNGAEADDVGLWVAAEGGEYLVEILRLVRRVVVGKEEYVASSMLESIVSVY